MARICLKYEIRAKKLNGIRDKVARICLKYEIRAKKLSGIQDKMARFIQYCVNSIIFHKKIGKKIARYSSKY